MNTSSPKLKLAPRLGASAVFALSLLAAASAQAAFDSGSTGADGALNPTVNTEIVLPASGVLNYTSINIPAGVTVTFKKNTTNTPIYLLASGNVTIAGTIDIRGADAKATGTYGDGALGDDGIPGAGGPGGFDGGRGGRDDAAQRVDIVRGGGGLGPGGGRGGIEGGNGCVNDGTSYFKYEASGGAYADSTWGYYASSYCDGNYRTNLVPSAKSYGSALLQPLVGGSGGGGGRGGTTYPGSGGGGGGGAILIAASGTMSVTGTIDATGGDAGGLAGTGAGGYGAGGSGGAVRLMATSIAGNGKLYAAGGCMNYNNTRRQYCGITGSGSSRGGAPGRIRLEAEAITFNGTADPAYNKDVPGPVFLADAPSLRIASVAGQAVPENPTGNADVTLPADTTTAVEVTFQTRNVPVGNTVLLRVVPAYGKPTEAITPAIAGTAAAGTAAVSVVLPSGPSTLQATTTYTVVVAGDLDLSRFAQNEAVDKVEVTVSLHGETRTRVLTASGKAYDVPYRALLAAGFRG
ncbi:MAG: hypothetical protein IIA02_06855 [Proteobacteria bacterium]|uniref:hypothetical protein n=1 Tax=Aquabacterium sp. TaxID=1872578 RepID=UPI0035C72CA6|nr:hypothetical protein [Pseudomonadota bacterium]